MVSRSASVAARVRRIPSGLKTRDGARLGDFVPAGFATGPEWPSCADAAAPSAWIASVSCRSPRPMSGLSSVSWCPSVLPARVTAQYATVVIPTPPAATCRWNSMRSSVTTRRGVRPSKVAALMMRLRSVSGPSRAAPNAGGPGMTTLLSGTRAAPADCHDFPRTASAVTWKRLDIPPLGVGADAHLRGRCLS